MSTEVTVVEPAPTPHRKRRIKATSRVAQGLAKLVRESHEKITDHILNSLQLIIETGEYLTEAKGQLEHGEWIPWVENHCIISPRAAQYYMRVAKNRQLLLEDGKNETDFVFDGTLRGALQTIRQAKRGDRAVPVIEHKPVRDGQEGHEPKGKSYLPGRAEYVEAVRALSSLDLMAKELHELLGEIGVGVLPAWAGAPFAPDLLTKDEWHVVLDALPDETWAKILLRRALAGLGHSFQ